MHRIDTTTAQKDKWGAGKNGWTNGDPTTGVKATSFNASFCDAIQEEICNAIEKSGLVLDPEDNTQLFKVLSKITTGMGDYLAIDKNLSEIAAEGSAAKNSACTNIGAAKTGGDIFTGAVTFNQTTTFKNNMEIYAAQPYIDFHFGSDSGDYTSRLIENVSGNLEVIGGFSVTKSLSAAGITSSDNVTITSAAPELIFTEVDTGKKYIFVGDGNSFRLDEDSTAGNNVWTWTSSTNTFAFNGNISVKNTIQLGSTGSAILDVGDTDSGLRSSVDGQVDLWANGVKAGYWNKTVFSFTGEIIPTNYANFDARYQRVNTASRATSGWYKDTNTGMILQWGKNGSTAVGNATVTFPIAFPNACLNVQNTLIRNANNPGENVWGFVTSFNNTSANLSGDNLGSYWFAVGY